MLGGAFGAPAPSSGSAFGAPAPSSGGAFGAAASSSGSGFGGSTFGATSGSGKALAPQRLPSHDPALLSGAYGQALKARMQALQQQLDQLHDFSVQAQLVWS